MKKLWILLLAPAGCATYQAPPPVQERKVAESPSGYGITYRELDQLNRAFAARYVTLVANACSAVKRDQPSAELRARAHTIRLMTATAAYDIVSGDDPYARLLDLAVMAELQKILWSSEGVAVKVFGPERGPRLAAAMEEGSVDAWRLVDRVLKAEQKKVLRDLIHAWRRDHPEAESVVMLRFDEFATGAGTSGLNEIPRGSGLLAPIGDALREVEQARMLAERSLYLAKRMPLLASWHAESLLNDLFNRPETVKLLEGVDGAVATLARVAAEVEKAPERVAAERKAILAALDEREKALAGLAKDVRISVEGVQEAVKSGHELVRETRLLLKEADPLLQRVEKVTAGSRPFNILEYATTASELTKTVREANLLLKDGDRLLESTAFGRQLEEVDRRAATRFNQAALLVAGLVTLFFALLLLTRWLTLRMKGSGQVESLK